jgi:hypothetical protein
LSDSSPRKKRSFVSVGAILLELNNEWAVQRARYMTLETIAPVSDDPPSTCPHWQADQPDFSPAIAR